MKKDKKTNTKISDAELNKVSGGNNTFGASNFNVGDIASDFSGRFWFFITEILSNDTVKGKKIDYDARCGGKFKYIDKESKTFQSYLLKPTEPSIVAKIKKDLGI